MAVDTILDVALKALKNTLKTDPQTVFIWTAESPQEKRW